MDRIASPQDLASELNRILAYTKEVKPSRDKIAADLNALADRLAAGPELDTPQDIMDFLKETFRRMFPKRFVSVFPDRGGVGFIVARMDPEEYQRERLHNPAVLANLEVQGYLLPNTGDRNALMVYAVSNKELDANGIKLFKSKTGLTPKAAVAYVMKWFKANHAALLGMVVQKPAPKPKAPAKKPVPAPKAPMPREDWAVKGVSQMKRTLFKVLDSVGSEVRLTEKHIEESLQDMKDYPDDSLIQDFSVEEQWDKIENEIRGDLLEGFQEATEDLWRAFKEDASLADLAKEILEFSKAIPSKGKNWPDPRHPAEDYRKALTTLAQIEAKVPAALAGASQIGALRDCFDLIGEMVQDISGKTLKTPNFVGATERFNPNQLRMFEGGAVHDYSMKTASTLDVQAKWRDAVSKVRSLESREMDAILKEMAPYMKSEGLILKVEESWLGVRIDSSDGPRMLGELVIQDAPSNVVPTTAETLKKHLRASTELTPSAIREIGKGPKRQVDNESATIWRVDISEY